MSNARRKANIRRHYENVVRVRDFAGQEPNTPENFALATAAAALEALLARKLDQWPENDE